jgi:K+-sensing histidine kinase KdpD
MGLPGGRVDTAAKIATHASWQADLAVVHCCQPSHNGENLLRETSRMHSEILAALAVVLLDGEFAGPLPRAAKASCITAHRTLSHFLWDHSRVVARVQRTQHCRCHIVRVSCRSHKTTINQ